MENNPMNQPLRAQELRIGNRVAVHVTPKNSETIVYTGSVHSISPDIITVGDGIKCEYRNVFGIPLSESILEKCLSPSYDVGYYKLTEDVTISVEGQLYAEDGDAYRVWIGECHHLHKLQNIAFDFGTELTVKL